MFHRSLGVCTLEILFGALPFADEEDVVMHLAGLVDDEEEVAQKLAADGHLHVPWAEMYWNGEQMRAQLGMPCKQFVG